MTSELSQQCQELSFYCGAFLLECMTLYLINWCTINHEKSRKCRNVAWVDLFSSCHFTLESTCEIRGIVSLFAFSSLHFPVKMIMQHKKKQHFYYILTQTEGSHSDLSSCNIQICFIVVKESPGVTLIQDNRDLNPHTLQTTDCPSLSALTVVQQPVYDTLSGMTLFTGKQGFSCLID